MPKQYSAPLLARKRLIVIAISACFSTAPAWANPTGPAVVNGSASIAQTGKLLTVTNSNGAIINWNSFSIGAGESTRFNQASAASSVLNRVVANDPSVLLGTLSSNGKVWLVNPAGILVGAGARIDVAGFVASTLNVKNEDFLAGRLNFQSTPNAGKVENYGQITTPSGGSVYLVAPDVENHGSISAPNGEVILAAGQRVELIDTGTPGVKVEVVGEEGRAANLGVIAAEAGRIGIAGVLVKNSGKLDASSVVREGGRVFLRASRDAYVDGAGRIVTTGTKGGSVDVLGERVAVMDQAQLDASGTNGGGQIRVGGDYQGKNPGVQNADRTFFGPQAVIKADATLQGDGGKVILWADDTTRAYGTISAKGGTQAGNGGFVETSGHRYLDVAGIKVDTSAAHGSAGNWLLDPTNISIIAGTGSGSFTGGVFDNGGGTSATVYGGDISTALNTTNVTIQTSSGGAANGDITVTDASIANNSNSARTLTLRADRSIAIADSTVSGNSAGGSLGVTLNAAYGGGAGNVSIEYSSITTYGGAVVIGGGADPKQNPAIGYSGGSAATQSGVYIHQTSIVTGGGALDIRGTGFESVYGGNNYGIYIYNSHLDTSGNGGSTGGVVTLTGTGGSGYDENYGVYLSKDSGCECVTATILTGGGALNVTGTGGGADGENGESNYGIYVDNETLDTSKSDGSVGGKITLNGTGGNGTNFDNYGVSLYGATILTGGEKLEITGVGGDGAEGRGISIHSAFLDTSRSGGKGGDVSLDGTGAPDSIYNGYGVDLNGSSIVTGGGALGIIGHGVGTGSSNYGIYTYNSTLDTSKYGGTGGAVTLTGTGGSGTDHNHGVFLYSDTSITTGGGALSITGNGVGTVSSNYGIYIYDVSLDTSNNGGTGGAVTFTGTGGSGSGNNYGVYLLDASITTGGGALDITGSSGGTGDYNYGIYTYSGALDTGKNDGSTGGNATLTGTGGNGVSSNIGVLLDGGEGGFTRVHTGGGALNVTGTGRGTGNYNNGINTYNSILDTSTGKGTRGGDLILTGTGSADAGGTDNHGVYFYNSKHFSSGDLRINGVATSGTNPNAVNITSGVALRADSDGTGSGKVIFGSGNVVVTSGNHAAIYYNPDSYAGADATSSDATHNPYSAQISGPGTYTAWMLVNDAAKLQAMDTNLAGNYALGRNIDASGTSTWNGGQGFAPVGPFAGKFDGLMQVIKGLTINRPATDNVGLFGQIGSGASVKNVGLAGGSVTGRDQVGALAGNNQGSIYNAYNTGTVDGNNNVGGLVGTNSYSLVNSYTSGAVSGAANVGGLLGRNEYGGSVSQTYAIGKVSGSSQVGGLVGRNEFGGSVSTSYATGSVPGAGTEVGGLVGRNDGTVSAAFWDSTTAGTSTGIGGGTTTGATGMATSDMMTQVNFTGWNFSSAWWMSNTDTRPFLRSEWSESIQNAHQLQLMDTNTDSHASYKLADNIDIEAELASGMWSAKRFLPVGNFYGKFDGMNHTISNLVINRSSDNYVGLFSYVESPGVVKNIGLVGGSVTGANYVGDLVGYNDAGSISNSYSSGSVTGSAYAGGLVGQNVSGSISNSYSTGTVTVTSSSYGGGLVGWNEGTIYNTYSTGAVTAPTGYGGGLVGYDGSGDGISNSYWNTQTSGLTTSSGGVGKTSAQLSQSATFSGWSIADSSGSSAVWRIYEGQTAPLLRYFLKPITVTAKDASKVYDKLAFGGNDVTNSAELYGVASYSGAAMSAVNVGSYAINASGFYSDQQGYDISYAPGTLSITPRSLSVTATGVNKVYDALTNASVSLGDNRLAGDALSLAPGSANFDNKNVGVGKTVNVSGITLTGADAGNYSFNTTAAAAADITVRPLSTWVGGASGNWSVTSNWDALPDLSNVLEVTVPTGTNVTYDAGVGTTSLASLTAGGLSIAGGTLNIAEQLTLTSSFSQNGGTLAFGSGANASITQASGNLSMPGVTLASLSLNALAGAISQSGAIVATSLNTQSLTGATLTDAGNKIANFGASNSGSGKVSLTNDGALNITGISNSGGDIAIDNAGAITQSGAIVAAALKTQSQTGTTLNNAGNQIASFDASNSVSGDVTLTNTGNLSVAGIFNGNGNILIDNTGAVTTVGAVSAPNGVLVGIMAHSPLRIGAGGVSSGGNIVLRAGQTAGSGDTLILDGPVASSGSASTIELSAGDDLVQNSTITASGGAVSASSLTGNISMGLGASTRTGGGSISYSAASGNIVLTSLDAGTGSIALKAGKSIGSTAGFNGTNLIGGKAVIAAGGDLTLRTQVRELDVDVGGHFSLTDALSGSVITDAPSTVQGLDQIVSTINNSTERETKLNTPTTLLTTPSGGSDSKLLGNSADSIGGTEGTFGGDSGSGGGGSKDDQSAGNSDDKKDGDKKDKDKKKGEDDSTAKKDEAKSDKKRMPTCS